MKKTQLFDKSTKARTSLSDNDNDGLMIVTEEKGEKSIVEINNDDDDLFTSSQIEELLTSKQSNTSQSTPNQMRFKEVSTEKDILQRMKDNVPQKTKYQNSWGASAWRQWAEWRNTIEDNTLPNSFDKVPLLIQELSEEQLGFCFRSQKVKWW